MTDDATLWHGDCLELMGRIPDGSVDLIAADLPYGTTACKWDTVIPFGPLWSHYRRIIMPRGGVIVLTAAQPFASALVMSNPRWFRYEDIWAKTTPTGFLDANRKPMRRHENILVFSPIGSRTFNPQMTEGPPYKVKNGPQTQVYGKFERKTCDNPGLRYPTSIVQAANARIRGGHPTQKPVALFEYLIRTHSNPGDTVLDNTMGSGTTGVACVRTGRKFIGIEKDAGYFEVAQRRIAEALAARASVA